VMPRYQRVHASSMNLIALCGEKLLFVFRGAAGRWNLVKEAKRVADQRMKIIFCTKTGDVGELPEHPDEVSGVVERDLGSLPGNMNILLFCAEKWLFVFRNAQGEGIGGRSGSASGPGVGVEDFFLYKDGVTSVSFLEHPDKAAGVVEPTSLATRETVRCSFARVPLPSLFRGVYEMHGIEPRVILEKPARNGILLRWAFCAR